MQCVPVADRRQREPEFRGAAMGFFEMICAIAFMVASALGGISAELVNSRTPYGLSAVAFAFGVVVLGVLLPTHPQSTKKWYEHGTPDSTSKDRSPE